MAERFTADLLFILFVLLIAALLGLLIGWLIAKGRSRKRIAVLEEETENLKAMVRRLEARLGLIENENKSLMAKIADQEEDEQALRGEARKLDDENDNLNLTIGRLEKELAALKAELNKAAKTGEAHSIAGAPATTVLPEFSPEKISPDDLEEVIGIGPKIAKLLMNRGITTWKSLSETAPNYLEAILHEDGGERFRVHNPANWPHQARLLHEGRWDEFRELRDRLWKESR